jgi:hypothetical protein
MNDYKKLSLFFAFTFTVAITFAQEKQYVEGFDAVVFHYNDIDETLALYLNNDFQTGRYKWDKIGTNALKADVYLWNAQVMNDDNSGFNVALNILNKIQPSSTFGLLTNCNDIFSFTNKDNRRRFTDDVIIYRYADVLLLKTEIKNALGQDAMPEIMEIPTGAYKNNIGHYHLVNGTPEEDDIVILQERLVEFVGEGKCWWDLIRFDKVFEMPTSYMSQAKDRNVYLFPTWYNYHIKKTFGRRRLGQEIVIDFSNKKT